MPKKPTVKSKKVSSKQAKSKFESRIHLSWHAHLKEVVFHHKMIGFLLILLALVLFQYPYQKYKDWDNAQLIKGLARDFPILVSEIEQATGLTLVQKVDCSTTQEKYSAGVRTCELSTSSVALQDQIDKAVQVYENSKSFIKSSQYDNKEGFQYRYRDKQSCSFRYQKTVYISCITAVRDANIDLAREVFQKRQ